MSSLQTLLQQSVGDGEMMVAYLTTKELNPVGTIQQCDENDLEDPNTHVLTWNTDEQQLIVDSSTVQGGAVPDLANFLENRRPLWLTVAKATTETRQEEVLLSEPVGVYLDRTKFSLSRKLWLAVAVVVALLAAYYLYLYINRPPPVVLRRRY